MFFTKEFQFTGTHAEKVRSLTSNPFAQDQKGRGVFLRNIDVLLTAPLIGLTYKKKSDKDNYDVQPAKINLEQLQSRKDDLMFVLSLIALNSRDNIKSEERIERAFKKLYIENENEEIYNEFIGYLLGGIDYLYNELLSNAKSFDEVISRYNNFLKVFSSLYPVDGSIKESIFDQNSDNL